MPLTGPQLERIQSVFAATFDRDDFRRLVHSCLDVKFDGIAPEAGFDSQLATFLAWADRQGKLRELIQCASLRNPSPDLAALWAEAQTWPPTVLLAGDAVTRDVLLAYAANVQAAFAHWADQPEPPDPPLFQQPPPLPALPHLPARPADAYLSVLGQAYPQRVTEFRNAPTDAPPMQKELTDVLQASRRSIIVGEPGAGKTAALERMAWLLATAALDADVQTPLPLPILAPLARYGGEADLLPLLTGAFNQFAPDEVDAATLRQLLKADDVRLVLLLDGLNELGGRRDAGVQALHATLARCPQAPIHITVRTADFDAAAELEPDQAVLPQAEVWQVLPLADEILFWDDADPTHRSDVRHYLRQHLPEAAANRLWDRIYGDDRLRSLATIPLLLYMLKEVGGDAGGELPLDRGALARQFVQSKRLLGGITRKDLRERAERCLEALGWYLQERRAVEIDVDGFTAALAGVAGVDVQAMRDQLAACRLLVDDGSRLRLLHQLIQEYGAAASLVRQQDGGATLRMKATDEFWRETVILALWLDHTLHTPDYLMGLMGAPAVDLRVRVAAATILGEVGDPRFPVQTVNGMLVILPALVEIPAGLAQLGGDDPEANANEKPGCTVAVAAFALGIYPVTNAEYKCFMAAGGYEDKTLWTPAGQAWLRGEGQVDEESDREFCRQYRSIAADPARYLAWTQVQGQAMSDEEVDFWGHLPQRMTEDEFVDWASSGASEQRRAPVWWEDGRYNRPTQPVVGVNWYEAMAYAAWLARVTGDAYHLPTEAEWEWAARRSSRRFPWGSDWDPSKCNWSGSRLNCAAPVGIFPHGVTPDGLHDLAGNVFDWTLSLYRGYPYVPGDGREDPQADGMHVLRGGSWAKGPSHVRGAYRYWYNPRHRFYDSGFRLARTCS